ncbi:LacI family DNA-binding transcriptional regulator [Paenibacillus sp. S150]|uniref:substrate-binding domain-containing protein n=1 Tax=Paenibacillus sp. S150 TaxID=2749826 RepID=UPI001C59DE92|nr:LacI family DNA-binding transcriptional regulator [Paenibacillus sp. S150]MBW4079872.1 LacI family DNA-binding transcriptional regulator [Paenibacillus sp. S150]
MSRKKVTLQQLAAELGLSRMTVSKALRGLPGMSLETRREVLELAQKIGYRTREQVDSGLLERTSLAAIRQRRFFIVLEDQSSGPNSIHMELIKGLNEGYRGTGCLVTPLFLPPALPAGAAPFAGWAEDSGLLYADGIFIPPMILPDIEQLLLQLPLPRVLINFPPSGAAADSVIWDVYDSVRQGVGRLAAKSPSRILYVGDTSSTRGFRLRWSAFLDAMDGLGIRVDPAQHLTFPFSPEYPWQQRFQQLLQPGVPYAILNTIEGNLPWVHYLCTQAGLQIPDPCSLVTLDVKQTQEYAGVDYFYMPVQETGSRAADLMLWRIANPHRPYEHVRIQGHFLSRP